MRIGKWVPVYMQMLPIPHRLALAFGLTPGSELYMAPIEHYAEEHRFGSEIIVSPVPAQSWQSVCRLSVRLHDRPKSLATATNFLRQKRINILLSESGSTYQHKAHWDAVCDLNETPEFSKLSGLDRTSYANVMENFLGILTTQFSSYMEEPSNQEAFLLGADKHVQFTSLTGLNNASHICDFSQSVKVQYKEGGIEIPDNLARFISRHCNMAIPALPEYAMITGNTEQRYLRVLFLNDYSHLFRLIVRSDLHNFMGGGIGVLNQLLMALPKEINLIKTSNHILERGNNVEKNHIELIGHWTLPHSEHDQQVDHDYMQIELRRIVASLKLQDANGLEHIGALNVVDFSSPHNVYPRVFISYSTRYEKDKLESLRNILWDNYFHPVLGTDFGQAGQEAILAGHTISPDIVQSAFQLIPGCVAFISLQVKRDDFKVLTPKSRRARYILPPWSVAEEVYAWSSGVGLIIRLKDADIEDPRYNRNTLTVTFSSDIEYREAVKKVIEELNKFRHGSKFNDIKVRARRIQYQKFYPPVDA